MKNLKYAKGGKIIVNENDVKKFSKIGITDKYDIDAINDIGLANVKFTKDDILERIKNAFLDLSKSYSQYIISQDSKAIENAILVEIKVREKQGDTQENIEAYKLMVESPKERKRYIDKYAETQLQSIKEWIEYLNKSSYPYSFRYTSLKAVLNYNYDYNIDAIIQRTNKTIRNFTPFDAGSLAIVYDAKTDFFLKDYTIAQLENAERIASERELLKTSSGGRWLKFNGGSNATENEIQENSKELMNLVQNTYWCTKSAAYGQLEGGDFYVYVTENNGNLLPRIAIRMEENEVGEVRGNASAAQDIEPEMLPIAKDFLENNIPNNSGKKWLDGIEYNERAIALYDDIDLNGFLKAHFKEYINLKKDEQRFLLDYASENGNITKVYKLIEEKIAQGDTEYEKGNIVFDLDEFDAKKTKIIFGNAYFENSKIKSLGNLETIGGTADFRDSQIEDLGNLETIGGDAEFDDSQIEDLGSLKTIGGDAYFRHSKIESLGNLEAIGGSAHFSGSKIKDLGSLKTIGGNAYFEDSKIKSLGNLETIGGDAYFEDSQIEDLGNLKSIGGDINFENFKIKSLGNLKIIGGYAIFRNSQIEDLGNLKTIVGAAYFGDSQIKDLGNLKSIGGSADFENSKIKSLGNLKIIGGYAIFKNSQIEDLGNLKTIVGAAYFGEKESLKKQWDNRKNRYEQGGNTEAFIYNIGGL